jgi:predicted protein tyrosine phosphatase
MQKMKQETVEVSKGMLNEMANDIEHLLEIMELIVEKRSMEKIQNRLEDIKKKRVKCLSERDFNKFMRKEDINAG